MSIFLNSFATAFKLLVSLDQETYGIIFLSLKISLLAVGLGAGIGIPLGLLIALKKFTGKNFLINIVNTFMGLPPVVAGLVVYILLSNQIGLLGQYRLLFTQTAMVIAQVILAIPIICGLTIVAVHEVDDGIRKTAVSLGANSLQAVLAIVKEARYGIFSAVIVGFSRLMAEVGAVMMVGGNIRFQTRVMTTAIAMHRGMGEFDQALALGIILLITSFVITMILSFFRSGREHMS
jgi:tungstate transport system permease protein